LLAKEWWELWASRAWWLTLLITGPLVGFSFISAVTFYAEVSGFNGTASGVGEAFSPLVGVWAPTFSAYEIIATFLFPFVVILLVGGDRQTGAMKLELQHPLPAWVKLTAKAIVLGLAWAVALIPAMLGVALWVSYGGHLHLPEVATVVAGHTLNAALTVALGAAAAMLAEHPSTAAIITLGVTIGTWVISFASALRGGVWERIATMTPPALVAQFSHGLIRLDVTIVAVTFVACGLAVAAVWSRTGERPLRRIGETSVVMIIAGLTVGASTFVRPTWDMSENRQNSFRRSDEIALRQITAPLHIEAHFALEDGRRTELERMALSKLRRTLSNVSVTFVSQTAVGLHEQNTEHYGEIIYTMNGRQVVSRIVTTEGVLDAVYELAGVTPPEFDERDVFVGYPLATTASGAAGLFYGVWPAGVFALGAFMRRRT
jgi:hypothetical protein